MALFLDIWNLIIIYFRLMICWICWHDVISRAEWWQSGKSGLKTLFKNNLPDQETGSFSIRKVYQLRHLFAISEVSYYYHYYHHHNHHLILLLLLFRLLLRPNFDLVCCKSFNRFTTVFKLRLFFWVACVCVLNVVATYCSGQLLSILLIACVLSRAHLGQAK
jgi:hypothetical protein